MRSKTSVGGGRLPTPAEAIAYRLVRLALRARRKHGRLENVAVKLRAHAFDDLVIEQLVSLSFAAEDMPLTLPTVLVLGADNAARAHPPELARAPLSHPESIAFGFVSSHPRWRAHPACGIQRIGRSAESVCLAGSTCVGAPICRASGTHLAVLLTLLCGCGNTSRWRTGDRHSHTNENNPPTTPTTIAAFVPNCSPSTPPSRIPSVPEAAWAAVRPA